MLTCTQRTFSFTTRNGNGRTKDLRTHLRRKHSTEYDAAVESRQLKTLDPSPESSIRPSEPKKNYCDTMETRYTDHFTKGEFQCLLQNWLAEDPQVNKHPAFIAHTLLTYF